MSLKSVSIKRFREVVDNIEEDEPRQIVKIGYLLSARASELCEKCSPSDILSGKSRPYGQLQSLKFEVYEHPNDRPMERPTYAEKVLVITSAVAKRGKRTKIGQPKDDNLEVTKDDIEKALAMYGQKKLLKRWMKGDIEIDPRVINAMNGKVVYKAIALPATEAAKYEPWMVDVLTYAKNHNMKLTYPHTRQYYTQQIREAIKPLLPAKSKYNPRNILRHFRLSHLAEYYNFDGLDLSLIAGWSMKTAYGMQGMNVSSNLDVYLHLSWKKYYPKLLRPIAQFT